MSNTNSNSNGSTSPLNNSMLPPEVDAPARSASALQSQYQAMAGANNPFGLGSSMAVNPFLLQQDLLRRQNEIERAMTAASASPSGLDRAQNQYQAGAELAALMARGERPISGIGGMVPGAASAAGSSLGTLGLGIGAGARTESTGIMQANRQPVLASSMQDTPANHAAVSSALARLSADERDRLSKIANETYQSSLEANGLATGEERKMGDKDLAHEAELQSNIQRRLMEEEALAEQQKQAAAASVSTGGAGLNSLPLERAQLFRLQQQEELFREIRMRQLQLPNEHLLGLQSRIGGGAFVPMTNPYALLGALPTFHAAAPFFDEQAAITNMEKAYSAKGSPENDIISKFLKVVTSHVPEITDMLTCFFPVGLVDNAQKFRAEFPRVVEATLEELRMMQDRASRETGCVSRGLYGRLTSCIAAIDPYRNITTNLTGAAAMPNIQDDANTNDDENASSEPLANVPLKTASMPAPAAVVPHMPWTCHRCGNDNLATKARCSTCQGWKGGFRENKPKKRKHPTDQSADTVEKKVKGKKHKVAELEQDLKEAPKTSTASKKSSRKTNKVIQSNKKDEMSELKEDSEQPSSTTSETKAASTKVNVTTNAVGDHMDAADALLGLMGGSPGNDE